MGEQWYNKYRPKTLSEYSGDRIKNMVKNRFKHRDNLPHVILLSGERGCGKTTCERILAKYYLCENPTEDGEPCECCEACRSVNEILINGEVGVECPGIQEYDTSAVNGKSPIADIISDAVLEPMYTKYKIIAFDECHTLTTQAQNALLKTLEDIPNHLVVILCTTNKEKLLAPVLSRVQFEIQVSKQSVSDMTKRLNEIAVMERLTTSNEALELIAKKGNRVPRECITLLENVAMTYDRNVTYKNVMDYVSSQGTNDYLEFFKAANNSLEEVMHFINKMNSSNTEESKKSFIDGLIGFVLECINIRYAIGLDEYTPEYVEAVSEMFQMYSDSDFDALLQIIEHAMRIYTPGNDSRNTLVIINTAMRISKVDAIANGLTYDTRNIADEDSKSMAEHIKKVNANKGKISEKMYEAVGANFAEDTFSDVHEVAGGADMFQQIIEDAKRYDEEPLKIDNIPKYSKSDSVRDEIEAFFSNQN